MLVKERDIACFCGGFSAVIVAGLLLLVVLLGAAGCTSSRPAAPAGVPPLLTNPTQVQQLDSAALAGWLPRDYTNLPAYLVPPPPGSTAKQRRQWQKAQTQNLARAGVGPAKIKNSSVATAPGATAINRPTAPVATNGSTATDARKAGQRQGTAAVGPGGVATSEHAGVPWWVFVLVAVCGAAAWEWLRYHVVPFNWLSRPASGR
jgi:type VI protein secretion system component VasF